MYDVAITGIGIVSSIGIGTREVTESLQNGKSGIIFDQQRLDIGFRGALTGIIKDYPAPELSRKKRKTMTEFTLHAYTAVLEAIKMSGLSVKEIANERTGLIIGNDSSTLANVIQVDTTRDQRSTLPIGTSKVFQALNSTTTMNLNTLLGNKGVG